ncbi:CU044_2847 family protein [Streptomyces ziwulingensis]|uniref:CU044_2847 family protein n=1 Tax=Streptomyces ziwulingensis TaxID=1045501 RepID=A0ABP9CSI4_9ACTN
MEHEVTRVARIALPDGTPVWARISGAAELPGGPGELSYSDTGFAERVEASVESLHTLVTGVARSLAEPLRAVRPDEVSVQFGIELTAKAGKVVGLLADGEAKAGLTVTLTWNGGPPDPGAPRNPDTTRAARAPAPGAASHPGPAPAAPQHLATGAHTSRPGRTDAFTGAPEHGGAPDAGTGGWA